MQLWFVPFLRFFYPLIHRIRKYLVFVYIPAIKSSKYDQKLAEKSSN